MTKDIKKRVTITLTPKSHEKIKNYAKEKHTTVSGAIEDWIWNGLDDKFVKKNDENEEDKDKEDK